MYDFQPKALTDRELIKYGKLWLDDEPLPENYQRELLLLLLWRRELSDAVRSRGRKNRR